MSESGKAGHNPNAGPREWRADYDELELRMDALREAYTEAIRSFNVDDALVERIHARFDDLGEQIHRMHCSYPWGGWPGQEACRFEPAVPYESAAKPAQG